MKNLSNDEIWQKIMDLSKEIRELASDMIEKEQTLTTPGRSNMEVVLKMRELEQEQSELMDEVLKR